MKRRKITWKWEDPEAQAVFAEWAGFPGSKQTSEELDKIEALVGVHPPMKVLDVGCGTGRHALEMAQRGYKVVGIDVAATYIDEAKREAEARGLDIVFRLQRGAELEEVSDYHFVLAFYHTLGFMTDKELARHFARIKAALMPTGKFLLMLAGPRLVPGMGSERTKNWAEKEGKFILSEKYIDDEGYRNESGIVIEPGTDEIKEFHERQKAFSYADVISVLRGSGFRQIDCWRDLDGNPATPEQFGVFVCRR